MYLIEHADEVVEDLMKEGYQKKEAVQIVDYMLGEEALTLEEAKEKTNEDIIKEQKDKEKDKEGKDLVQGEAALLSSSGPFDFGGPPDGQNLRNRDDGQSAGELHNGSLIQGVGAGVHAVPGGRGGGNRGGVVHGRAGKQAEALVGQAQNSAQGGENKGGKDVEQEDHGDRLGDLFVVGTDDWGGGGDRGAAAHGGCHAGQSGPVGRRAPAANQR